MAEAGEEEDDYLSMTFEDAPTKLKETSLQRTARLKKEAAERGLVPSKADLAAKEKSVRDAGLATALSTTDSKGAQMMAKMGFKGGALGKSSDARTQPIELLVKDDRGGIGMDSEKKRKVREAAEQAEQGEKRQRVGLDEFRERNRVEREEKRAEGLMWGAMKVLEGFDEDEDDADGTGDEGDGRAEGGASDEEGPRKHLKDVNVLYRPLVKQRLEKERERKMRYDLNNSLSTRNDEDDSDGTELRDFDKKVQDLDDEDLELEEFEQLSSMERLERVVKELREKHFYCFWCKYRYPDANMDGCPGLTEDEHG